MEPRRLFEDCEAALDFLGAAPQCSKAPPKFHEGLRGTTEALRGSRSRLEDS
jgi:hypothetical protein